MLKLIVLGCTLEELAASLRVVITHNLIFLGSLYPRQTNFFAGSSFVSKVLIPRTLPARRARAKAVDEERVEERVGGRVGGRARPRPKSLRP